eukprot:10998601-Alexandrium_andersonii.AAC.1
MCYAWNEGTVVPRSLQTSCIGSSAARRRRVTGGRGVTGHGVGWRGASGRASGVFGGCSGRGTRSSAH